MPEKKLKLGGQAVVEGVLMMTEDSYSVAVRKPNEEIAVKKSEFNSLKNRKPFSWPLIRGAVTLFEMLYIGMKAISWSANQAAEDEEEMTKWEIILTIAFSLGLALVLFKLLPLGAANIAPTESNLIFNLIDGLVKVAILVAYIWAISLNEEVHRMFQYHSAEHKTIHAYQDGLELTEENIKKQPKEHPACGTSFILLVLILSIIFYMFIPFESSFWVKYGLRVLLLPVIAGVSYEIVRLATKNKENFFFRGITAPGIWLQYITTKEPEDDMIEVAVEALESLT